MARIAFLLLAALTVLAADNPWDKVRQLPNRSELRVYKKGARQPLNVVLADANEDRIVVVEKKTQLTIQKDDIDRIDARPIAPPAKKATVTKTETTTEPDYTPHLGGEANVPGTSSSSGVSFGGGNKPDFKTVYMRPAVAPKK